MVINDKIICYGQYLDLIQWFRTNFFIRLYSCSSIELILIVANFVNIHMIYIYKSMKNFVFSII